MTSLSPFPEKNFDATVADPELLARWTRGEESAFTAFFRRHAGLIYNVARREGATHHTASGVVQNVMTAAARKAAALQMAENLPGWLHRAALLEMRRHRRTEAREIGRRDTLISSMQTDLTIPVADDSALQSKLDSALLRLRDNEQSYVFQRFYEGRSVREIAARAGESEGAVQKRGHRALERLAALLSRRGTTVNVPVVMALVSRGLQSPAPAELLQHGPAASLKAAAATAGWWSATARWHWPVVQAGTACALLGAAVWQEQFIADPRSVSAAGLPPAHSPGLLGNSARLTARSFQTPAAAFDPDEPDLAALAEFSYRYERGAADHQMSSKLFFQIGDWFGPHRGGKGLELLSKLYGLDIPPIHRRALAARLLDYDWLEIPAKLEWTIRFHAQDDPPGEWHDNFTRSIVTALSRWAKEDTGAAWQWLQKQLESGSLHEAKGSMIGYASGPQEKGLASLFIIASEKGEKALAEEILASMNAKERGAALGSRLQSLTADSADVLWCLEQIAALSGPRLQAVGWSEAQGWPRDASPEEAANLMARLLPSWNAPASVKAEFITLAGPRPDEPRLQFRSRVFRHAGSEVAAAMATATGRQGTPTEIAELMPAAVERGCWQEMARAAKDRACHIPSGAHEVSRFAAVLPWIPDNTVRTALVREWREAAAKRKVTRDDLLKGGVSAQDLNLLMPEPAAP